MTEPSAKVICDSISPQHVRLTTIEATMHRFVLAELNTHRVFSRNSASSRAIPITKTLERVVTDCAWPMTWASEQPGMQGGVPLEGDDLRDAQILWGKMASYVTMEVRDYLAQHPDKPSRLHKSLLNRLLEPFMWHTVIITSTEWANFFRLRCSPLAMPEIRMAAEAMLRVYDASTPQAVGYEGWHLPYIDDNDEAWSVQCGDHASLDALKMISVARCARVSALTHDGVRDRNEDIAFYGRLHDADPAHASPFEHVATPTAPGTNVPGNFHGWHQLRHIEGLG